MRAIRKALGAAVSAVIMAAGVCSYQEVYAVNYTAPSNIEISVDSAEIDRSDLHGDTLVELPVYIRNNEGFVSLNVIFELDNRLRFDKYYNIKSDVEGIAGINIYNCSSSGNMIAASFEAENRFTDDGRLGTFRVIVPESTPVGTYELAVRESGGDFSTKILMYNNRGAEFGSECFSLLQGGSITVTDRYYTPPQEQPIYEPDPPKEQVTHVDEQVDENEDEAETENNDNATETTSPASTVSTSTSTTTARVTKKTSKTEKTATMFSRALTSAKNTTSYTSTVTYTEPSTQDQSESTTQVSSEVKEEDTMTIIFQLTSCAFFVGVCAFVIFEIVKGGSKDE